MAIQISGVTVIDNGKNINAGIGTFTTLDVPSTPLVFSPTDGATNVPINTDIVITFNQVVFKGIGNITLRDGSAGGTVLHTIDVATSSEVSISGAVVTITVRRPYTGGRFLELPENTNLYVVIDAGAFVNINQSSAVTTYNFTTKPLALGDEFDCGYLICVSGTAHWLVAPSCTEVTTSWYGRNNAVTCACSVTGCTGWFVPTLAQLQNPGYNCRTYWDSYSSTFYWSNTQGNGGGCALNFSNGAVALCSYLCSFPIRAFRCVTYS